MARAGGAACLDSRASLHGIITEGVRALHGLGVRRLVARVQGRVVALERLAFADHAARGRGRKAQFRVDAREVGRLHALKPALVLPPCMIRRRETQLRAGRARSPGRKRGNAAERA